MKPKNLFKSKTFWMQVLSIAAAVSGVIPLAAGGVLEASFTISAEVR